MKPYWLGTLLLALSLTVAPASAVTISLVASPDVVQSGDTVSFDIVVSDFSSSEFVSAFDLAIQFDPTEFRLVGDQFLVGAALGSEADVDYFDFTDLSGADEGDLLPYVTSLLDDAALAALQPGPSVTLGSFALIARHAASGSTATVGLTCNSAAGPLDDDDLAVLLDIASCNSATITFESVEAPEPGTLGLLVFGLLALAWARRPRQA